MNNISEETRELFQMVRIQLGAPIRKVEIGDDEMCTLLKIAMQDYSKIVLNWLTEHQWSSLLGKDITKTDIAFALTTRSLDGAIKHSYGYSKEVGLQARGPYELKKDFFRIEPGKQVYQIPAGREMNDVLWITPPTTDRALMSYFGGGNATGFGTPNQVGTNGGSSGGYAGGSNWGYYITPAFDVLLAASDMKLKQRMMGGELAHKITAGPNGTRLIHLMGVPGSKLGFGNGGGLSLVGCEVWYEYYDIGDGDIDECRKYNKDIIKLPNEVPLKNLDYGDLNDPAQTTIRQLLTSQTLMTLAMIRGMYSGELKVPNAELTMDYDMLISRGNQLREDTINDLKEQLDKLLPKNQLEDRANEAESLNTILRYVPRQIKIK